MLIPARNSIRKDAPSENHVQFDLHYEKVTDFKVLGELEIQHLSENEIDKLASDLHEIPTITIISTIAVVNNSHHLKRSNSCMLTRYFHCFKKQKTLQQT